MGYADYLWDRIPDCLLFTRNLPFKSSRLESKAPSPCPGDTRYVSDHAGSVEYFKRMRHVLFPATFFATEPVIAVLGGHLVLFYTLFFSFFLGFDHIFKKTYGLPSGLTGSCFAAIVVGSTAFTLCAPWFYSLARRKTEYVRGTLIKPEFRLWSAILAAVFLLIFYINMRSY